MSALPATGVGLVGGGRWAATLATALETVRGNLPVRVFSASNPGAWSDTVRRAGWRAAPDLDGLLGDPVVSHVVIARRAADHAATAHAALSRGHAVLVEKPFALTAEEAGRVVLAAAGRACHTGIVFALASNQIRFREAVSAAGGVSAVRIRFEDPAAEVRWGQVKRFDPALNVVQDVFSHAWALARPLLSGPLALEHVSSRRGGAAVHLDLTADGIPLAVSLERHGSRRLREIEIECAAGLARLDFSTEPGTARIEDRAIDVASGFASPLETELSVFIDGRMPELTHVGHAIEAIEIAERAVARIRTEQAGVLRAALGPGARADAREAGRYALAEVLAGGIAGDGWSSRVPDVCDWLGPAPGVSSDRLITLKG